MKCFTRWLALVLIGTWGSLVAAEETPEVVLDGLDNPCGIAVQPNTGHVFVSDSAAGRVIRVVNGQAEDVITGFSADVYGKGPMYNIGPLGLAFLNENTLVIGGGGQPDGEEVIWVAQVPPAGSDPLSLDQLTKIGPLTATDNIQGEGNFYGVALTKAAIFVTSNGDDTKGWVAKADIKAADSFGTLERYIATKEAVQVDAPVGITISPRGEVVIGQMGEINIPQDSLLSFYRATDGELLLNLETGLFDITALAYGAEKEPSKKSHLYALDFAWMMPEEGGLYRLDAKIEENQQVITPVKIAALDKPAAMAFGKDGELYVAVFGTAEEDSDQKPGKLLRFKPGL